MYNNKQVANSSPRIMPSYVYTFEFKQLACDILWDNVTFNLLLTMFDPMTLSQTNCSSCVFDNQFFEHWQDKCWELSPTLKQFMPPMLQPKHMVFAPNDDPMQINKTWLKPFIEQDKQCWHVNNLCLYCEKSSHITSVSPN